MRRILFLLLVIALLTACGEAPPVESTATVPPETEPPRLAIQTLAVPASDYFGIYPLGTQILLLSNDPMGTRLRLISPDDGSTIAETVIAETLSSQLGTVRTSIYGMCYYNTQSRSLVFLSASLEENRRVHAPTKPEGVIVLQRDWKHACYSDGTAVFSMNLETGITNRISNREGLTLIGALYDGSALLLTDANGAAICISALDGSTVRIPENPTASDGGCVLGMAGTIPLVAIPDGSILEFLPDATGIFPLSDGGLVASTSGDNTLQFWSLADGSGVWAYSLPSAHSVCGLLWDEVRQRIWICQSGSSMLMGVGMETLRPLTSGNAFATHYSEDAPDLAGLQACQMQLNALGETYGIQIILGDETFERLSDCTFQKPYLPAQCTDYIALLGSMLEKFPQDFFSASEEHIRVGLFSSISGDLPCPGGLIWRDGSCYIVLSMEDLQEQPFYHAIGHWIANRVRSTCSVLDAWESCNPYGFIYGSGDCDEAYFPSPLAATAVTEDWAECFSYAMMEESRFASFPLQEKLTLLCKGIRKTFTLSDESHLWEQHLQD